MAKRKKKEEKEPPSNGLPERSFAHVIYDATRLPRTRLIGMGVALVLIVATIWMPLVAGFIFLGALALLGPPIRQLFLYQHIWGWLRSIAVQRRDGELYATDFRTPPGFERRPFDVEIAYVGLAGEGGGVLPVISPRTGSKIDTFFVILQSLSNVAWLDDDDRQKWNQAFMGLIRHILDLDGVVDVTWGSHKLPADPYDNMAHLGHRVMLAPHIGMMQDPHMAEQWNNLMDAHQLTYARTLDTVQILTVTMERRHAWRDGKRPDVLSGDARADQPFQRVFSGIRARAKQLDFNAVLPTPLELPMLLRTFLDPAQADTTYRRFFMDMERETAPVTEGGERPSLFEMDTIRNGPWVEDVQTDINVVRLDHSFHAVYRVENFGTRKVMPSFFNGMIMFGDDVGWVSHTVHASNSNGKVIKWFQLQGRNWKVTKSQEREFADPELHLNADEAHRTLIETAMAEGNWTKLSMLVHVSARSPEDLERICSVIEQMYDVQGINLARIFPDVRLVPAVLQSVGINVDA